MTLSGNASLADYQAALRSVEFTTTDPSASPAARTASFTVTDSVGATSAARDPDNRRDRGAGRAAGRQ